MAHHPFFINMLTALKGYQFYFLCNDFQNIAEYINNKESVIIVFESDVFINKGESLFNA